MGEISYSGSRTCVFCQRSWPIEEVNDDEWTTVPLGEGYLDEALERQPPPEYYRCAACTREGREVPAHVVEIVRDEFDEHGARYAECQGCGMGWIEWREPVDLFGLGLSTTTIAGEREHECPLPLPYETARMLAAVGRPDRPFVTDQRTAARIRLGLAQGPPDGA